MVINNNIYQNFVNVQLTIKKIYEILMYKHLCHRVIIKQLMYDDPDLLGFDAAFIG